MRMEPDTMSLYMLVSISEFNIFVTCMLHICVSACKFSSKRNGHKQDKTTRLPSVCSTCVCMCVRI
jgi:hypothetical protein